MNLDEVIESLPSYANDLKLNFSTVVRRQTELTEQQLSGTVVAAAIASRNEQLIAAAVDEAVTHLTVEALGAAKAAAAIMAMNNVFYRFKHLTSNEKYITMRGGLRMNVMRTHGIDPLDFELWAKVVSAINNCAACVDAHEKVLREKGFTEEKILAGIRVAAVLHAVAVVLDAEKIATAQPVGAELHLIRGTVELSYSAETLPRRCCNLLKLPRPHTSQALVTYVLVPCAV